MAELPTGTVTFLFTEPIAALSEARVEELEAQGRAMDDDAAGAFALAALDVAFDPTHGVDERGSIEA